MAKATEADTFLPLVYHFIQHGWLIVAKSCLDKVLNHYFAKLTVQSGCILSGLATDCNSRKL